MAPNVPTATMSTRPPWPSSHCRQFSVPRNMELFSVYKRRPAATMAVVASATRMNASKKTTTSARLVRRDCS